MNSKNTIFTVVIMSLIAFVGSTFGQSILSDQDIENEVKKLLAEGKIAVEAGDIPVFSLAISEYPSWSLFLAAHEQGFINMAKGKLGPVEKKWGVDIVLENVDYDTCIKYYGGKQVDAVCLTALDFLPPSLQIPTVGILPTSTSDGADQLITSKKYTTLAELKGVAVHGLDNSVSQQTFERILEENGQDPNEFNFVGMDPAAATLAFIKGDIDAIVVWNPFCMQAKRERKDSHVLGSSKIIPEEIIDMIGMSRASLNKKGGERFACAFIETYYLFNKAINNPKTNSDALNALGNSFLKLSLKDMRIIVKETSFYGTPESGINLFSGKVFPEKIKENVKFALRREMIESAPTIGYGSKGSGNFVFNDKYMRLVAAQMKK